jgi:hypothetical protein
MVGRAARSLAPHLAFKCALPFKFRGEGPSFKVLPSREKKELEGKGALHPSRTPYNLVCDGYFGGQQSTAALPPPLIDIDLRNGGFRNTQY